MSSEPDAVPGIVQRIRDAAGPHARIVFVSGNFNVVHPGHLRLLNFAAECGDFLVVGVNDDSSAGALIPEQFRLEGVEAISVVDFVFLLSMPVEQLLSRLKPDVVVKGKEHEQYENPEQDLIESYGGKLLFASGEVSFSSFDLLQRELSESNLSTISKPKDYPTRHGFTMRRLQEIVQRFNALQVVVIGDLIVDEYITCEPLGMSQEDPTIVVTPLQHDRFVGGAGIVSAHAKALGAQVTYFGVVGDDPTAMFVREKLSAYGVDANLVVDQSRPTTLKQRFRARGNTLLRVSHLRRHDISQNLEHELSERLLPAIRRADLVIFSDFNYGCLPPSLVEKVIQHCSRLGVAAVADSQSSSQIGDVSRFTDMLLVTPTEHEARLAMRDLASGLTALADALLKKARARHVFITLGAEGLVVHSPGNATSHLITDQLPAFNTAPRDVSGAGDCLLTCTAMALVTGANVWESAYLGSVAAACQVGRVGNSPLSSEEVLRELAL